MLVTVVRFVCRRALRVFMRLMGGTARGRVSAVRALP